MPNPNILKRSKLLENLVSLGFIQVINYTIGIIQTPYLIKTIGIDYFGAFSIAWVLSVNVSIFADFGFNYYAVAKAAPRTSEKQFLNELHNSILLSKIIIASATSVVLIIASYYFYSYQVFLLTVILSISSFFQVFFPVWYFQTIQEMKVITFYHFVYKVLIFFFSNIVCKKSK